MGPLRPATAADRRGQSGRDLDCDRRVRRLTDALVTSLVRRSDSSTVGEARKRCVVSATLSRPLNSTTRLFESTGELWPGPDRSLLVILRLAGASVAAR